MKYTVYQITHKESNKIYIGKYQTKDLNDGYMGSGKYLKHAQNKHGIDSFVKEILHVFDTEEEMNAKERELVTEEFCLREDTYNICVGGQGGFSYINRHKIGHKENSIKANKAFKEKLQNDPQFRAKISENNKKTWTKKRCEEQALIAIELLSKYNMSELSRRPDSIAKRKETFRKMNHSKGEKNSQFGSMWITNGTESKKIKKVEVLPEGVVQRS